MKKTVSLVMAFILLFTITAFSESNFSSATFKVTTYVSSPGSIYNGEDDWSQRVNAVVEAGEILTLYAKDDSNGRFLYWKDDNSGRIISKSRTLKMTITGNVTVTAMFASKTYLRENAFVIFTEKNGKILYSNYVGEGLDASAPTEGFMASAGYQFYSWDTDEWKNVEAGEIIFVNAEYEKDREKTSTIQLIGAKAYDGEHEVDERYDMPYDTKISVLLSEEDIPEDKYFSGFSINGVKATDSREFSFFLVCDCIVEAIYGDEEQEPEVISSIISADATSVDGYFSFVTMRSLPDDCTLIESGIFTAPEDYADDIVINNVNINRVRAKNKDNYGILRYNKAIEEGETSIKARSYIVYEKGGDTFVSYSPLTTITIE